MYIFFISRKTNFMLLFYKFFSFEIKEYSIIVLIKEFNIIKKKNK